MHIKETAMIILNECQIFQQQHLQTNIVGIWYRSIAFAKAGNSCMPSAQLLGETVG